MRVGVRVGVWVGVRVGIGFRMEAEVEVEVELELEIGVDAGARGRGAAASVLRGAGRGGVVVWWLGRSSTGAHHSTSSSRPEENSSLGGLLLMDSASATLSDLALSLPTAPSFESARSKGSDSERLMILSSTLPAMTPPVDRSSCRCSKLGSSSSGVPPGGSESLPNSNEGRSESAICSCCFLSSTCALIMLLAPCASCSPPSARTKAASRTARRSRRRFFSFQICGEQGGSGGDQGTAPASLAAMVGRGRCGVGGS